MPDTAVIQKKDLLDTCVTLEEAAAAFYRALAKAHAHAPALVKIWEKTAAEEDRHAFTFRMSPPFVEEMIADVCVSGDEVSTALKVMEQLRDLAQHAPPDPVTALRIAIKAEHALARFHMHQAAAFTDEKYRRMFEAMMAADKGHIDELQRAHRRLSGDDYKIGFLETRSKFIQF